MHKLFTIFFFCFIVSFTAMAQEIIRGRVTNTAKKAIVSASVLLRSAKDKTILKIGITDSTGNFQIESKITINSFIEIDAMGYKSQTKILSDSLDKKVFDFELADIENKLAEVNITNKKPLIERLVDRVVFNVENSISVIGGDALDALSKSPGVRVNASAIGIIGKNTVAVMVNNKLLNLSGSDLLNYLRSIPADNIKSIEIISNPTAKYDATGNTGLINIVNKKNLATGYNGTINTGLKVASYATSGLTSTQNYNNKGFHFSSVVTGYVSKVKNFSTINYRYPESVFNQNSTEISKRNGVRGDFAVDYYVNKNLVIGGKYGFSANNFNGKSDDLSTIKRNNESASDSTISSPGNRRLPINNQSFTVYAEQKLDTSGAKIEFEANYFTHDNDNENRFQTTVLSDNGANDYSIVDIYSRQQINIANSKIDITLPLPFANFSVGGKISFIKSNNQMDYSRQLNANQELNDKFTYHENVQALYLNANKKINKFSFQLGIRGEYTQIRSLSTSTSDKIDNSYLSLFPTAFLRYSPDVANAFSLTYGRRINRPNYETLNPFRRYNSIYSYSTGNPDLKPSFSNNIELSHNYKDWLNTSVYLNMVNQGFGQLTVIDPNTIIQAGIYSNYLKSYTYGISETFTYSKIKWLESNNQFDLYYVKSLSNNLNTPHTFTGFGSYVSTDNTILLNKSQTLMANVNFWYQFPELSYLNKFDSNYALNLGFTMRLLKKKLILSMNATDVFKTSIRTYSTINNGVTGYYQSVNDNRSLRLSIVYRFGNRKGNKISHDNDSSEVSRVKQ